MSDRREAFLEARELGRDVMEIVGEVAGHRLAQILEFVHDDKIKPLEDALRDLVMHARTSGGVAGRDEGLCAACDRAEALLQTN